MATIGTFKSKVYHEYFKEEEGFILMEPDTQGKEKIHDAIYNEEYGIKAFSKDITSRARVQIKQEIDKLIDKGAEGIILGCTELPLAVEQENFAVPVIDPGLIIARRLIELVSPEKLVKNYKIDLLP